MGNRSPVKLRWLSVFLVSALLLAGCVTETNNRLSQNRDPKKAVKAYVEAGMLYLQRNQMENAHRTLNRAYDIDPDDASVNNGLALFFSIEGDKGQTEKHFKKALTSDPNFAQARNNYAAFLFAEGRYEDAIEQLERVTAEYRYEKRYAAFENLGLCYLRVGRVEDAEKAFNRALKLNAGLPTSMLEMAGIMFDRKEYQASATYLANYEKIAKPSPRQLWLGIRLQRVLGDKNKVASYELALRNMFPASPEYQAYKAAQ